MHHILKSHHPIRQAKSFKYAFEGIFHAILHEANFRVQLVIVTVSVWLGFHFEISNIEWGLLIITLGALLSAEMLNTVVEELMDYFTKEQNITVKIIKDLSAGFVLVSAITSLTIMMLIFGSRVF